MTFLKLTFANEKRGSIFVNMVLCTAIYLDHELGFTSVRFDDENWFAVRETPEQIIGMLKEHVTKEQQQLKAIAAAIYELDEAYRLQHNLVGMGAQ